LKFFKIEIEFIEKDKYLLEEKRVKSSKSIEKSSEKDCNLHLIDDF